LMFRRSVFQASCVGFFFSPAISHTAGIANPESFRGNLQVAISGPTLAARPACRQTGANFTR